MERKVIKTEKIGYRDHWLTLECGHRRRYPYVSFATVHCIECAPNRSLGGGMGLAYDEDSVGSYWEAADSYSEAEEE